MQKWVFSITSILVIFFAAIIIIPIAFKDDIKTAIDSATNELVNADVVFEADDLSISLLTNFPNATAKIDNLAVINREPFEGNTLFALKSVEIEIDVLSLFSNKIQINGLELDSPNINILVRKDGTANYNIALSADETAGSSVPSGKPANFNFGINHWRISNANITYDDVSKSTYLKFNNLSHSGSGNFNPEYSDINTNTSIGAVSILIDGVEYLTSKAVSANIEMAISDNYNRYTFKKNKLLINDFELAFDGYLAHGKDGSMDIDMFYASNNNSFKGLLSLVPGIYSKSFKNIEAVGNVTFSGEVQGKYDSLSIPAFNLVLKVDQGMFQFPELTNKISNVNLDLLIDNHDGVLANTRVDLQQLQMQFGKSQVDAKVLVTNLHNYDVHAAIKASINLAELSSALPLNGVTTKGLFSLDVKANGIYDKELGVIPKIDAVMELVNGQVESSGLSFILDKLNFKAQVKSPTNQMADFTAVIRDLSMQVDGEKFAANLEIIDLNKLAWKLNAAGGIDLAKVTQLFPLENTSLTGKLKANFSSSGNMNDVKAKNYQLLTTSGNISLTDFIYSSLAIPLDMAVSDMGAAFSPKNISIDYLNGTVGKSDFSVKGSITNYMDYLFAQSSILKGTLDLTAKSINLNEFMTTQEAEAASEPEQPNYGVIEIPKNIEFVIRPKVETVAFMDLIISDTKGDLLIKDGVAQIKGLQFSLLEGNFTLDGVYDPSDLTKPQYDFNLDIQQLSARKAFETISVVNSYFPIAKNIDGQVSYKVSISGLLNQTMLPDLNTLSAVGELNINNAQLNNSEVLQGIGTLVGNKLLANEQIAINDVLMAFRIDDGQVNLKPFNFDLGGYKSTLSGSSSLTGALDFDIKMYIPAGKLGGQLTKLLAQNNISSVISATSLLPINFNIGGTYNQPSFKIDGMPKISDIIMEGIKEKVSDKLAIDQDAEKAKYRQKLFIEAQTQADQIITETKKVADKVRAQGHAQADKLYNESNEKTLKAMLVAELAKKIKKEADDSADKIEKQGKAQAEAILAKAKKEAGTPK